MRPVLRGLSCVARPAGILPRTARPRSAAGRCPGRQVEPVAGDAQGRAAAVGFPFNDLRVRGGRRRLSGGVFASGQGELVEPGAAGYGVVQTVALEGAGRVAPVPASPLPGSPRRCGRPAGAGLLPCPAVAAVVRKRPAADRCDQAGVGLGRGLVIRRVPVVLPEAATPRSWWEPGRSPRRRRPRPARTLRRPGLPVLRDSCRYVPFGSPDTGSAPAAPGPAVTFTGNNR